MAGVDIGAHMTLLDNWFSGEPSELSLAVSRRRAAGLPIADLITANPHEHGIACDQALVEEAMRMGLNESRVYRPDARGRFEARESVAAWHREGTNPDHVILTPGTSLAYWAIFRLLGDRGEVLCPTPTYPLFDDLARLAGVGVRRYHMACEKGHWSIDPQEIAFQVTPATRVLVLVSPHNPTGHVVSANEMAAIAQVARRHDLTIVFDEVFRDVLHGVDEVRRPSELDVPLSISLNGLSKRLALPGLKAGWMVAEGDIGRCERVTRGMEYLMDTLLPVNEAVQGALPILMRDGNGEVQRIAALYRGRMRAMIEAALSAGFPASEPDGGIYILLPLPDAWSGHEEELALRLVEEEGVLLHPGNLYGIRAPHLVATAVNVDESALRRAAGPSCLGDTES